MSKVNVFITVDTEHSFGGACRNPTLRPVGNEKRVFCRIANKAYGIPLIMDIADCYGLRLTFFLEVLNKCYFGPNESREACELILKRNHDIQLHIHPGFLNFTLADPCQRSYPDLIGNYSLEQQIKILDEAKQILIQFGVQNPIAFRAGCFGVNMASLTALKKTGFLIDSSYNRAYLEYPCLLEDMGINDIQQIGDVTEFPITNFIESAKLRRKRFMPLDINGVSFGEMEFVLNQAKTRGPRNITIILHSFSFIKPYDIQYNNAKPRWHVIRRFEKLCCFLRENSDDFAVKTFGSLDEDQLSQMTNRSVHTFPKVPAKLSLVRGLEQLKDNLL